MIGLQLLGGLDVEAPELPHGLRARRRNPLLVLAVVAASAPNPLGRDRIMAFLWPESDASRASNSLRQALHSLRYDLGSDLFLETSAGLQLDRSKISVDLWCFRDALARKSLRDAVAAHRGPFLDGFDVSRLPELSRWVDAERAVVQREFIAALDALSREAEEAGTPDEAVAWRRRQAAADPFSSRAALGLIKALAAAGDRSGALACAGLHERFIRAHLEVEPDPAIREFVDLLRRPTPPPRPAILERESSAPVMMRADTVVAPGDPVSSSGSPWVGTVRRRIAGGRRWVAALGIAGLGIVGVGSRVALVGPVGPDPVIVLASGAGGVGQRDSATQLINCEGHGCPAGSLPQLAFIIPQHAAYNEAAPGTHFIAPIADAATTAAGAKCCTTAVFEQTFSLPPDATSATISLSVLADNQASAEINGVEFGRQSDKYDQWNFAGPAKAWHVTFMPDPSGTNRLRVTLWDGGGVMGLNFRAAVKYDRGPKPNSGEK